MAQIIIAVDLQKIFSVRKLWITLKIISSNQEKEEKKITSLTAYSNSSFSTYLSVITMDWNEEKSSLTDETFWLFQYYQLPINLRIYYCWPYNNLLLSENNPIQQNKWEKIVLRISFVIAKRWTSWCKMLSERSISIALVTLKEESFKKF